MSNDSYKNLRNPEIRKLCESLKTLPEYLERKRREIEEYREFCRRVFEDALRKSGLLDRHLK
jgi:hypothetical protein